MNNDIILTTKKEWIEGGAGFKVIEVNVKDPSENSFAVCTPVNNNNK